MRSGVGYYLREWLVCTNLRSDETDVQIINTGISDHTAQLCRLTLPVSCANSICSTRRHLNVINLLQLKQLLSDLSWHDVLSIDDVGEAYNLFTYSVSLVLDSTCPRKKTRRHMKSRKIIYDSEARKLKEEYLRANNLYLLTNDVRDKQLANNFKKLYDLKLRYLRLDHSSEHILSSDNKSKAVWDVINSERKMKKGSNALCLTLSVDGEKVEDPMKVADHFNEYFTTIADETMKLNPPRPSLPNKIFVLDKRASESP
ncbi:hypothetical protein J6590_079206 [Homalodisca vitripennis]|nr:hypothetical protein J6590_079206 [Homalodisca vitripennis]